MAESDDASRQAIDDTLRKVQGRSGPPDPHRLRGVQPPAGWVPELGIFLPPTQGIAQAALRRANALKARLDAGLTGGDLRAGAIDQTKLAPGLRLAALSTVGATPGPPTATHLAKSAGHPGRVRLSAGQLAIMQRMAQSALQRANALVDRLAAGLTTADFRPGSLGPADVSGS